MKAKYTLKLNGEKFENDHKPTIMEFISDHIKPNKYYEIEIKEIK